MPEMCVADRIRFFESKRSGNIYIVGHGQLGVQMTRFTYRNKVKGKWKTVENDCATAFDSGGLGGSLQPAARTRKGKLQDPSNDSWKFTVPPGMAPNC
jgi:hypothetical protein